MTMTWLLIGVAIAVILVVMFFRLRAQDVEVQKEIVSPKCGGEPEEREFEAEQDGFARVVIVPLALCGEQNPEESVIEIVTPEGEVLPVGSNEHRPGGPGRRDYTPSVGEMWLVAVPRGGKVRLKCPGGDTNDCRFLVAPVQQDRETGIQLTPETDPIRATGCGDAVTTRTGIYNTTRVATQFEIVFDKVCKNGNNEVPPRIIQRSIKLGVANGPASGTAPGGTPRRWRSRRAVDPGNTVDVVCPGTSGGCAFHVIMRTTRGPQ